MNRSHPIRWIRDLRHALGTQLTEHTEARKALNETGWLHTSGGTLGDDIRKLSKAWADAEIRAAKFERERERDVTRLRRIIDQARRRPVQSGSLQDPAHLVLEDVLGILDEVDQ